MPRHLVATGISGPWWPLASQALGGHWHLRHLQAETHLITTPWCMCYQARNKMLHYVMAAMQTLYHLKVTQEV